MRQPHSIKTSQLRSPMPGESRWCLLILKLLINNEKHIQEFKEFKEAIKQIKADISDIKNTVELGLVACTSG